MTWLFVWARWEIFCLCLIHRLPYNQYFGGVSALSKEQFLEINGFPNNYWGWGGEDDDIFNRQDSAFQSKQTFKALRMSLY